MFKKIVLFVICILAVSAKEKKGICASIPEGQQSAQVKAMCLQARIIEAQKTKAEAAKQLRQMATPAENEALRRIEKEQKSQIKARSQEIRAMTQARIEGCDPNTVWVSPNSTIAVWGHGWLQAPYISVRFNNPRSNGEAVDIEASDYGLVIKNLGPGCRATVYRQFHYGVDGEHINYSYRFIGRESGAYQIGPSYNLYVDMRGNGIVTPNQTHDWNIQLQR